MATPQGRTTLANNILAMYQQFDVDGIDIDWEYPGQGGNHGNVVRPDDSANFLEFLRTLRGTLPPGAIITAATQTVPFADANGNPMGDVSEFAKVLDWCLLMNYDTWGCESSPSTFVLFFLPQLSLASPLRSYPYSLLRVSLFRTLSLACVLI